MTATSHIVPSVHTTERASRTGNILVLAYACGPGRGSEESVGWDTAAALAESGFHVTVLTRTSERNTCPRPSERPETMDIVCHDNSPSMQRWFDRMGKLGVEFGYLRWLHSAKHLIGELHEQRGFTSAQHVTYARYWMPSALKTLDIPWILGPVGGGESIPSALRPTLSHSGLLFEALRDLMRLVGEHSASVRHAASSSVVAFANTRETAARLEFLGAPRVEVMNSAAVADEEFARLATNAATVPPERRSGFISIGRLLDWKGFHLGLQAFAESALQGETFTIVGTGPFEKRLRNLAQKLGISERVHFTGVIPRDEVFRRLSTARALVHPSLHESGGFVCLEAMASGTPVICLDVGGPGLFVTPDVGFPVAAHHPSTTITSLAEAMRRTISDPQDYRQRQERGLEHVRVHHTMSAKTSRLKRWHDAFAAKFDTEYASSGNTAIDAETANSFPDSISSRTESATLLRERIRRDRAPGATTATRHPFSQRTSEGNS